MLLLLQQHQQWQSSFCWNVQERLEDRNSTIVPRHERAQISIARTREKKREAGERVGQSLTSDSVRKRLLSLFSSPLPSFSYFRGAMRAAAHGQKIISPRTRPRRRKNRSRPIIFSRVKNNYYNYTETCNSRCESRNNYALKVTTPVICIIL